MLPPPMLLCILPLLRVKSIVSFAMWAMLYWLLVIIVLVLEAAAVAAAMAAAVAVLDDTDKNKIEKIRDGLTCALVKIH